MSDDNDDVDITDENDEGSLSSSEAVTESAEEPPAAEAEPEPEPADEPGDLGSARVASATSISGGTRVASATSISKVGSKTSAKSKVSNKGEEGEGGDEAAEKGEVEGETAVDLEGIEGQIAEDEGEEEEEEEEEEQEPEPEPEPPRYIEPLGVATEETLMLLDYKSWILDKLYREGRMGRLGMAEAHKKLEDGGSTKYEDYKWQLEKFFRTVPEDMSLGNIRLKPDELLYEEERWVLGKLFREINEDRGYMPQAEKHESVVDVTAAVPVNRPMPKEPLPCFPPPSVDVPDEDACGPPPNANDRPCSAKVTGKNGQVFEFAFTYNQAVDVSSDLSGEKGNMMVEDCTEPPVVSRTSISTQPPPPQQVIIQETLPVAEEEEEEMEECIEEASKSPSVKSIKPIEDKPEQIDNNKCKYINPKCESEIEAICKVARNAMAIYDTLTGSDNFPCNLGDKEGLDSTEVGVWSWLYQVIYKLVPMETDNNENIMTSFNDKVSEVARGGQNLAQSQVADECSDGSNGSADCTEDCKEDCPE